MKIECVISNITENTTGPAEPGGPRGKQRSLNVQPVRPSEKDAIKWNGNLQAVCEGTDLDKFQVNDTVVVEVA